MQQDHHEQRHWAYSLGGSNPERSATGTDYSMNYCPNLGQTNNRQQFWERRNQAEMDPRNQHANLPAQKEPPMSSEFQEEQNKSIVRPSDLLTSHPSVQPHHRFCNEVVSNLGGAKIDENRAREVSTSLDARNLGFEGATEEAHRQTLLKLCEARESLGRSAMIDQGQGARRNELLSSSVADPPTGWSGRHRSAPSSQAGGPTWGGGGMKDSGADVSPHRLHGPKSPLTSQARPTHPPLMTHMVSNSSKQVMQAPPSMPNVPPGPHPAPHGRQGQNQGLYMANVPPSHLNWNSSNVALGSRFPLNQGYPHSQESAGPKTFQNQSLQSWEGGHPSKMNFPSMHIDAFGRAINSNIAGGLPVAQSNVILPGTHNQQLLAPHIPNPYLASFMNGQIPPTPCYSQLMTQAAMLGMQLQPQLMVNLQAASSLSMMASEHQLQQQKSFFKLPRSGNVLGAEQMPGQGQISRIGKFLSKAKKPDAPLKTDQQNTRRKTSESNSTPVRASRVEVEVEKTTADLSRIGQTQKDESQGLSAGNEIDLSEEPIEAIVDCGKGSQLERGVSKSDSLAYIPTTKNGHQVQSVKGGCSSDAKKRENNEKVPTDAVDSPINVHAPKEIPGVPQSLQVFEQSGTIDIARASGERCPPGNGSQKESDQVLDLPVKIPQNTTHEPTADKGDYFVDPSIGLRQCEIGDRPMLNTESNDSLMLNNSRCCSLVPNKDAATLGAEFDDYKETEACETIGQSAPVQNSAVQFRSDLEPKLVADTMNVTMSNAHADDMFQTTPVDVSKLTIKDSEACQANQEQNLVEGADCGDRFVINVCWDEDEFRSCDHSCTGTDQSGTDYPMALHDMQDERIGSGASDGLRCSLKQIKDSSRKETFSQSVGVNPDRSTGSFLENYLQTEQDPIATNKQDQQAPVQYDQYPKTRLCIMGNPDSRKPKSKCPKLASFGLPKEGVLLCSVNSTVGSTVVCCLADSQQVDDPESLFLTMGSMVPVPVSLDSCVEELQSEIQSTRELNSEASSSIKSPGACSTQVYEIKTPMEAELEDEPLDHGDLCQIGPGYDATSMEGVQYDKKTLHPPPIMEDTQTSKRVKVRRFKVYSNSDDHSIPANLPGFTGLVDVPVIDASQEDALPRNPMPCPAVVHAFDTTVVCSLRASKRQGLDTVFMSTPVLQDTKSTVCAVVGFDYKDSAILCWTGADRPNKENSCSSQFADDQLIDVPIEEVNFVS